MNDEGKLEGEWATEAWRDRADYPTITKHKLFERDGVVLYETETDYEPPHTQELTVVARWPNLGMTELEPKSAWTRHLFLWEHKRFRESEERLSVRVPLPFALDRVESGAILLAALGEIALAAKLPVRAPSVSAKDLSSMALKTNFPLLWTEWELQLAPYRYEFRCTEANKSVVAEARVDSSLTLELVAAEVEGDPLTTGLSLRFYARADLAPLEDAAAAFRRRFATAR